MDILDKARQLEGSIARGMTAAARSLARKDETREPIELTHAIVEAVEREIQPGGRGTRVFAFNRIEVSIVAPSDHARAKIDTIVNGEPSLRDRIIERLRTARCDAVDLDVRVNYVARAQKQWTDPQFAIEFSRVARDTSDNGLSGALLPRIEMTVVHGVAEHRTYAFASHRIELGRGNEVRDSRHGLIRTNHVAFSECEDQVNRAVSRQHAHIAYDPGSAGFRLYDDGSAYGTKITRRGKSMPVPFGGRGVRLQSGDEIVLGEARVRVKFEDVVNREPRTTV